MEFDRIRTGLAFVGLLVVLLGPTLQSMPSEIAVPVSAGLVVFSVLFLFLGVKHGEYRAARGRL